MQDDAQAIVVILGQGIIKADNKHWTFLSEYPDDNDVYINYLNWAAERIRSINPLLVVTSGGYTSSEHPKKSEAYSMFEFFRSKSFLAETQIIIDDLSLDTAENAIFSCMAARMALDGLLTPVTTSTNDASLILDATVSNATRANIKARRALPKIIFLMAWRFKALRMSIVATHLKLPQFEIHGFAEANAAKASEKAVLGEAEGIHQIMATHDILQIGCNFENKKQKRFAGGEELYKKRLERLSQIFPETFQRLRESKKLSQTEDDKFSTAFQREVISPAQFPEKPFFPAITGHMPSGAQSA
jgi:hypothetical protein